ncbi:response regulator transcription factor [uncultured Kordia sp.]|uniref:response regulator n=1 Tax=uncultured Kordia sp. TaxID=507699 RepID=UPI00261C933D|nr:response regulator transcription factor [uncultured Kordia sp.]
MKKLQLLICDDHNLVSEGIAIMLQSENRYEIQIVTSGKQALQYIHTQVVDVLILDISMPEMSGLDVLDALTAAETTQNVLMLTMHDQVKFIKDAISKGAKGYVLKSTSKAMLIDAIEKVAKGENFYDPRLTTILLNDPQEASQKKQTELVKLTPREIDILKLIAQNKKTKEIADMLFISVNTVQSHKKNLYSKLNIHSVSELVTYAFQHGFVEI